MPPGTAALAAPTDEVAALAALLLVMGAFRVVAVRFSPPGSNHAADA